MDCCGLWQSSAIALASGVANREKSCQAYELQLTAKQRAPGSLGSLSECTPESPSDRQRISCIHRVLASAHLVAQHLHLHLAVVLRTRRRWPEHANTCIRKLYAGTVWRGAREAVLDAHEELQQAARREGMPLVDVHRRPRFCRRRPRRPRSLTDTLRLGGGWSDSTGRCILSCTMNHHQEGSHLYIMVVLVLTDQRSEKCETLHLAMTGSRSLLCGVSITSTGTTFKWSQFVSSPVQRGFVRSRMVCMLTALIQPDRGGCLCLQRCASAFGRPCDTSTRRDEQFIDPQASSWCVCRRLIRRAAPLHACSTLAPQVAVGSALLQSTSPQLLDLTCSHARVQAAAATKYYVLQYSYVPDMMSKRDPYRQTHLDTIKSWVRLTGVLAALRACVSL